MEQAREKDYLIIAGNLGKVCDGISTPKLEKLKAAIFKQEHYSELDKIVLNCISSTIQYREITAQVEAEIR